MKPDNLACAALSAKLSDYVDSAIPPGELLGIEAHLGKCARCRRLCDDLRITSALLSQLPGRAAPPHMKTSILFLVRSRATSSSPNLR
ncbi:MAG: anti-sigma factor family protein [Gemmatimonadota bacterium]